MTDPTLNTPAEQEAASELLEFIDVYFVEHEELHDEDPV